MYVVNRSVCDGVELSSLEFPSAADQDHNYEEISKYNIKPRSGQSSEQVKEQVVSQEYAVISCQGSQYNHSTTPRQPPPPPLALTASSAHSPAGPLKIHSPKYAECPAYGINVSTPNAFENVYETPTKESEERYVRELVSEKDTEYEVMKTPQAFDQNHYEVMNSPQLYDKIP